MTLSQAGAGGGDAERGTRRSHEILCLAPQFAPGRGA